MNKRQRSIIFVFCEGVAEENLFVFLRTKYSNKKNSFNVINLGGFDCFDVFLKKYSSKLKEFELRKEPPFWNVRYLFFFDNDLEDSCKIKNFLEEEGYLIQQSDPNIESVLLSICGKKGHVNTFDEVFRRGCKNDFESYFGKKSE